MSKHSTPLGQWMYTTTGSHKQRTKVVIGRYWQVIYSLDLVCIVSTVSRRLDYFSRNSRDMGLAPARCNHIIIQHRIACLSCTHALLWKLFSPPCSQLLVLAAFKGAYDSMRTHRTQQQNWPMIPVQRRLGPAC